MGEAKKKSIVALNEAGKGDRQALELFEEELCSDVIEVRGRRVKVDLGDFAHIQKAIDGGTRIRRIRYIRETLYNPEEIRESVSPSRKGKTSTEVYLNTIFASKEDQEGELCKVVVEPSFDFSTFERYYRFKTFYLPDEETWKRNRKGRRIWSQSD